MSTGSVLSYHFASPERLRDEDEWIGLQLDQLDAQVARGQLSQAAGRCQGLLADFEGHCAFEELVMARIDFPWAPGHCADHADLQVAIARLLREIRRTASSPQTEEEGKQLRQQLSGLARDAHIHVARQDARLQRFAARVAGCRD